jgi:Uma2 family endonuclease
MPTDRHPGPNDLLLVVEVADSSVEYDRNVKAQAYGEAGIPEYWGVDLENEVVEVFRRPEADGYAERIRHRRGDDLSVTTLPDLDPVPVADILGEQE